MNFKIGDKVKVNKFVGGIPKAFKVIGTVVGFNNKSPYPVSIDIDGMVFGFTENELELYKEEYKGITINNDKNLFTDKSYNFNINGMEEIKEDKMEKTFREVIADIKEGEVWESNLKTIKCHSDGIQIYHIDEKRCTPSMLMLSNVKFKLKRKEYTFEEAFKAYEEGKEIESCDYRYKKIDNLDCYYSRLKKDWQGANMDISLNEIRNKWYINE